MYIQLHTNNFLSYISMGYFETCFVKYHINCVDRNCLLSRNTVYVTDSIWLSWWMFTNKYWFLPSQNLEHLIFWIILNSKKKKVNLLEMIPCKRREWKIAMYRCPSSLSKKAHVLGKLKNQNNGAKDLIQCRHKHDHFLKHFIL